MLVGLEAVPVRVERCVLLHAALLRAWLEAAGAMTCLGCEQPSQLRDATVSWPTLQSTPLAPSIDVLVHAGIHVRSRHRAWSRRLQCQCCALDEDIVEPSDVDTESVRLTPYEAFDVDRSWLLLGVATSLKLAQTLTAPLLELCSVNAGQQLRTLQTFKTQWDTATTRSTTADRLCTTHINTPPLHCPLDIEHGTQ